MALCFRSTAGSWALRSLLLCGLACAASAAAAEPDPNFYVFLCFGQSNMEGSAPIEEEDRGPVDERFMVLSAVDAPDLGWKRDVWRTATPPLCRPMAKLGPVDSFGRTLVEELPQDVRVGVVHVAIGGCKIELFQPEEREAYIAQAPPWMRWALDAYGNDPYGRLVELAKLAQQRGVIKGVLLHQGESNTGDAQWPQKVKSVYDRLVDDLGLADHKPPLLAGEVVHADQGGVCASMNPIINRLPEVIPNARVVSSAGCEDLPDNLHFSSAGCRELGRRYAEAMLELLATQGAPDQEPAAQEEPAAAGAP